MIRRGKSQESNGAGSINNIVRETAGAILESIKDNLKEQDADVQLRRARALALMTEAVARFEFKTVEAGDR